MASSKRKLYFSIMSIIMTLVMGVAVSYAWFTNINQQGINFVISSDSLIFAASNDITDTTLTPLSSDEFMETAVDRDTAYDPVTTSTHLALMASDTKVKNTDLYLFNNSSASVNIQVSLAVEQEMEDFLLDDNSGEWDKTIGGAVMLVITAVTDVGEVTESEQVLIFASFADAIENGNVFETVDDTDLIEVPIGTVDNASLVLRVYVWLEGTETIPAHSTLIGERIEANIIFTETAGGGGV